MRAFFAFFKKELLELTRNGKLMVLFILFCAIGIMNPAVAKLTPWLLEVMGQELAESGMVVTGVSVDALTSWTQFFKNIPMALIAFGLIRFPSACVKIFSVIGYAIKVCIIVGLSLGIIRFLTGYEPLPGLETLEEGAHSPSQSMARRLWVAGRGRGVMLRTHSSACSEISCRNIHGQRLDGASAPNP